MKRTFKNIIFTFVMMICAFSANTYTAYAYDMTDFEEASRQLEEDVEKYHIPGMSVIVVDADKVLFSETYGNCESTDTSFIIGSMSKSFTALSVMQLAEKGDIDLDKPVSYYIDPALYFKIPSDGDKITVRQLLNQTSGLDTYAKFGTAKITDSCGTYLYANVNYYLLGKIIESVSGVSYSGYVEQNIFAPLGMEHTSADLENSRADGLISGYRNYFGINIAGEPDYPDDSSWSGVPAGYISSSAADMGKYLQMYLNGGRDIISRSSLETMFYDNVPCDESGGLFYGMGWMLSYDYGEPCLTHAGLVENYTSNMFIFPESGIGIAVLINRNDYFVGNNILGNVIMPLLGEEKQEFSVNPYIVDHILIDLIYLLLLTIALYPLISIGRWKKMKHTKKLAAADIIRHGILPVILLALSGFLGVPLWVVWYFVKDLFIVLTASSALLLGTGVYKAVFFIGRRKYDNI